MNYAKIKYHDIANGPGVRVSLFVSGCRNHCKNCFNPETWDFNYGKPFTAETQKRIINAMRPEYIKGFTLLGGDPFEPENAAALAPFMEKMRVLYPQKSLWCFTGYDYEKELLNSNRSDFEAVERLLNVIDVLVDGRFVDELKDLNLRFRGSSNQRIIDVIKSRKEDKVVLWNDEKEQ